jgi:PEP-CTERM motif-containing protein
MRKSLWIALFALALGATAAHADTISYTGTLSSPEDFVDITITLATAGTVDLQTYGFGGGTNAAGTVISAGGTDPFLAIFSGTGSGATILTDGLGNPFGTALDLVNYENPNFGGCPPAGAPTIGGSTQCGDITITIPWLAVGTYTVLLSDGQYFANAVFDNGTLGEGFTDFTGGAFCNIAINGVACLNTSGAYALDITTPTGTVTTPTSTVSPVPEPGMFSLLGSGLIGLGFLSRRRRLAPAVLKNE